MNDSEGAALVVTRLKRPAVGVARSNPVILDGQKIGALRWGETRRFEVAPGEHRLRIKADWTGSPEVTFTATVGSEATFVCRPRLSALRVFASLRSSFARDRYLTLEQVAPDDLPDRRLHGPT